MKKKITPRGKMISSRLLAITLLITTLSFSACNNTDDDLQDEITNEEAVEVITASLESETYGLSSIVEDVDIVAEEKGMYKETPDISCGELYTRNFSASNFGTNYFYDYQVNSNYQLNCNNFSLPESFIYNQQMAGNYETSRIQSDDNAKTNLSISNLAPKYSTIIISGNYDRKGSQKFKINNNYNYETDLKYTLNNLSVNKYSAEIISGTANATLEMKSSITSKNFEANITFLGDGKATVIINGISYNIVF